MSKTVISLTCSLKQREALYKQLSSQAEVTKPAFSAYQLRLKDCVITAYQSGKIVFQGSEAPFYAKMVMSVSASSFFPQAGSDEVGTGDYFGPVCVCAAMVKEAELPLLQKLGVTDSKLISDVSIRKIAPVLQKELCYSLLIVMPEKYNMVHAHANMNSVKAQLHNQAYINLSKKISLPDFMVVDQFTPERQYYSYLHSAALVISGLHFETKAESKYPAVAAASVIARNAFLEVMDRMHQQYGMVFAKGSGKEADQCAIRFVQLYGFEALNKVAKLHFKNKSRVMNSF